MLQEGSRWSLMARPLASPPLRRLLGAALLSEVGDWAARLALVVLVYGQTGSTLWAGAVAAAGLLPWLGPGQLLASLADRHSRRDVMVVADVVRAAAFGVAALGVPVPVLLVLVFVAGLAAPPHEAATAAVRPHLVPREQFPAVAALFGVVEDAALLLGYAAGGALVALLGASGALAFNAGTFLVSALLVAAVPRRIGEPGTGGRAALAAAGRVITGTPQIRRALALVAAAMGGLTAVTTLLAPYVLGEEGRGGGTVALLTAAAGVVTLVLTATVTPQDPDGGLQLRACAWLCLVGGAGVVLGFASGPSLPLLLVPALFAGALGVVIAPASVAVTPLLPDAVRASGFAVLMGVLAGAQSLAALGAGAVAELVGPAPAAALAGLPALVAGAWQLLRPAPVAGAAEPTEDRVLDLVCAERAADAAPPSLVGAA